MPELRIERPLRLFAPAKVNLGLEVLRKRTDGYHEILTIMQTISIFDEIILTPSDRLEYRGDPRIARDNDLVYRAVQAFQERTGFDVRARIRVLKQIPVAGGLGGGSSDAGTLIAALSALASVPGAVAWQIASSLGSDVPFFLIGGTALASGTGTTVETLPQSDRLWFVVVTQQSETSDKTAARYSGLVPEDFSDGSAVTGAVVTLRDGGRVRWESMSNTFTRMVLRDRRIAHADEALGQEGAKFVLPSGAGPSLFTITDSWETARDMMHRLSARGISARACTSVGGQLNAERIARLMG